MCRKSNCAFLQKGDYCLMHKSLCALGHQDAKCRDGVARLKEVERDNQHRYMKGLRVCVDKAGVKGACLHPRNETDRGKSVFLTCKRKHRFPTAERARSVAVYAGRKDGVILAVYECPYCHGYHLTRQLREHLYWNGNPALNMPA